MKIILLKRVSRVKVNDLFFGEERLIKKEMEFMKNKVKALYNLEDTHIVFYIQIIGFIIDYRDFIDKKERFISILLETEQSKVKICDKDLEVLNR